MKHPLAWLLCGLIFSLPVWAVYAPIPEQEQGKAWTVSLRTAAAYDSNIFGAASGAINSDVFTASPKVAFNASVTNQTFITASYQPTLDHFTRRPGSKNLVSHEMLGRVAHAFSQATTIDLSDFYQITKNPESLLPGVSGQDPTTINTNQSFRSNQFDGHFSTSITEKTTTMVKFRTTNYRFDNAKLGQDLDRTENLYGLAGSYDVLPETKAVAEYRHQDIYYSHSKTSSAVLGGNKDKRSEFVMGGADYKAGEQLTASARLGVEWRHREGERSQTAPTAELSAKYDYAPQSFITGGYTYTIEESSNVALYTDTRVNRFFVNVQHALTPLIIASGSVDYEPSVLQGRRGLANVDETTSHVGGALSYLPTKNWVLAATYDFDHTSSGEASRNLERHRVGLSATFAF